MIIGRALRRRTGDLPPQVLQVDVQHDHVPHRSDVHGAHRHKGSVEEALLQIER